MSLSEFYGRRVRARYNLTGKGAGLWGIEVDGKAVAYAPSLTLRDARTTFSASKYARVLRSGARTVYTTVSGILMDPAEVSASDVDTATAAGAIRCHPFKHAGRLNREGVEWSGGRLVHFPEHPENPGYALGSIVAAD
jgi:hypothetical protein